MSGFTTYNAAGTGGAGGVSGNVAFSYDPYYTASVPTQNIPSGTTDVVYRPGSFSISSTVLQVLNPQSPNLTYPIGTTSNGTKRTLGTLVGDFTVEAWIRPTSVTTGTYQVIISGLLNDTEVTNNWMLALNNNGAMAWFFNNVYHVTSAVNVVRANVWQHVAYVRSGTTGTIYVNGVSVATWTDTQTYPTNYQSVFVGGWRSGAGPYGGLISQPRITLSAVYTSTFVPNPNLGLATETVFYAPALSSASVGSDTSRSGQTISANTGTLTYSATGPADAPSSGMFLPDTTSNIQTAPSSAFTFGTGNFIVEYWINIPYTTSTSQRLSFLSGGANSLMDYINNPGTSNAIGIYNVSTSTALTWTSIFALSPNAWNHIAWGKSGSNLTMWVNGQQQSSVSSAVNLTSNKFSFNAQATAPGANVNLGPIRISNSAVYTTGTNFSPPTTFAKTANTVLLLQGGANLSQYLTDQSVNAITVSSFGNVVSGSAPTQYGISGNVVGDISGATNTGIILRTSGTGNAQGATFFNNYGGYWQFNGNTANSVIQSTQLVANTSSAFSLSTWFQTSALGTVNGPLMALEANTAPTITSSALFNRLYVSNVTNALQFITISGVYNIISSTGNVVDNKWHHAAITLSTNGTTSNVSMYIDGQFQTSTALGGTGIVLSGTAQWKIGGTSNVGGYAGQAGVSALPYFNGNIGPTAVYASTLTKDQVAQIYRTQSPRFAAALGVQAGNIVLSSTGTVQSFTVPSGITQMSVRAVGAAGAGSGSNGGGGANIFANIAVVPGSTYYAIVGRSGNTPGDVAPVAQTLAQGGGGGAGRAYGGGGGGFTGLFSIDPTTVPAATAQQYAILIAGGGGGATNYISTSPAGGAAALSLTGNSTAGYQVATTSWYFPNGWSSTGTQIVANVANVVNGYVNGGNLPTGYGNVFSTGMPLQLTGVGNVLAGQYLTVASVSGNALYLANGNVTSFPTAGNTGGNTRFQPFNYINPWNTQFPGAGGGSASTTAPGWGGLQSTGINLNGGTVTIAQSGSALAGGNGGSGPYGGGGGGGGGGGYYGGGGGSAGPGDNGSAGGGSSYANTQLLIGNTVTYGTINPGNSGVGPNGSMTVTWATTAATSANYGYSGDVQTFTVPQGVTQVTARVIGAAGGRGYLIGGLGGGGANIAANISVTPGQTLYMIVGQGGITGVWGNNANGVAANGSSATMTLFQGGGGGAGRYNILTDYWGGQGGGFSGIFTQFPSNVSVAANAAILVAGGGGGGSGGGSNPVGGNAAISLTGNASSGSAAINDTWYFGQGWSSTGTQIVANVNPMFGSAITQYSPAASIFATGMALQVTGIGNVLAGQYLTVASINGNNVYLNNGNVVSFPIAGNNTGSNTAIQTFNYANAWTASNPGSGGGPATTTAGGWYGLQSYGLNTSAGTYNLATSGSQFAGGTGGNSIADSLSAGGGGGGGGWYGGGGGTAGRYDPASGGGGSNYVSPTLWAGGVSYGTITVGSSGGTRINGNIQLSWTSNTATFTYTSGTVQTFTVPNYVTRLTARVVGAAGGASLTLAGVYGNAGGAGANISTTLAVTPGQQLYIVVGQGGLSNVQTAGNISQGGGGAAGLYYAGTGAIPGSSGGGFTGIFTADPSTAANATVAQSSAVLIAGGGGGGTAAGRIIMVGGNASATISANSSPGGGNAATTSTGALQTVTNAISDGTTVTINLTGGATGTDVNFSVGCPVSLGGGTFTANWIGSVVTANTTAITAVFGGGASTPAAATYTSTRLYAGGYNGTNVQPWNSSGGGWATPSVGGWQAVVPLDAYTASSARTMPTAGTALQGGNGGGSNLISSAAAKGGGGGGGWFGGGGGGFGGTVTTTSSAGSGGGGSNYANSQLIIANTVSYGTLTTNTGTTQINGNVFLSW